MDVNIIGGGWVTSRGYGSMNKGGDPELAAGDPILPSAKEIFSKPLTRYGRFDKYTKLGCAGIALALKDAGLDQTEIKRQIGIIISTKHECLGSDLAFYETTLEDDGSYSSPNLFSYTLPGIVIGESAIHFKLTGPTFTVGESDNQGKGINALKTSLDLLQSGVTDTMVAGWLDSPPDLETAKACGDDLICGAIFVVLSTALEKLIGNKIFYENANILSENSREIFSLIDIFHINTHVPPRRDNEQ